MIPLPYLLEMILEGKRLDYVGSDVSNSEYKISDRFGRLFSLLHLFK